MKIKSIDRLESAVTRLEERWLKAGERQQALAKALARSGRELDEAGGKLERLRGERVETGLVLEKAIAELAEFDLETVGGPR